MPRRVSQSSAALVQTAAPAQLPFPSMRATLALDCSTDAPGTYAWAGAKLGPFRILRVHVVKTNGNGGAGDSAQLQDAAGNAITNAMSLNVSDQAVVRATSIDDARFAIAFDGGLKVVLVDGNAGATDLRCIVYVDIVFT